jgi:hypothetical protein
MKKILKNHSLFVLAGLASIFLVIIIGFYAWGVSYLVATISEANIQQEAPGGTPHFNISAAAALDYRGALPKP